MIRSRFWSSAIVRIVVVTVPIIALSVIGDLVPWRPYVPPLIGVATLALYAAYVRLIERRPVDELGTNGASAEVGCGLAIGVALFAVTMGILWSLGDATVEPGDGSRALVTGFAAAASAALVEETLLRAVFFRIVEERLGTWVSLALSAVLFGALHAATPGASLVSTVAIALEAGILLAAAFVYTRRLWMPIGMHLGWNFSEGGLFGAAVSGRPVSGYLHSHFDGPAFLSGGRFGAESSIVAVLVCLVVGVALVVAAHRRGRVVPFPLRARRR